MELREYLRILRRGWIVVVITALAGAGIAAGITALVTPEYKAHSQLYISAPSDGEGGLNDLIQSEAYVRQAVASYVDVVTSARVLDGVISDLKLDMSAAELAEMVSATSPYNTVLIDITVKNSDPELAATIANSVGSSFADVISNDLAKPTNDSPSVVEVDAIQPATPPATPASPTTELNILLGFLVGMSVGLGIIIVRGTRTRATEQFSTVMLAETR